MEIIIKYNMLLPTVLYLTRTVYRERDRMAREFALIIIIIIIIILNNNKIVIIWLTTTQPNIYNVLAH